MRKLIGILACVLLMAALFVPVHAAESAQITLTPNKSSVYRGDTVTVTVSISGGAYCTSVGFVPSYDTNAFILVDGAVTASGTLVADFNNGMALVYKEATKASGEIGYFVLKAKADTSFSGYTVSGTASVKNASTTISSSVKSASVSVSCKHTWSGWSKVDSSNHTHKCSTCGTVETKAHTFDHGCDKSCNGCGMTRETSHDYKTEWSSTDEWHFHECSKCGDWKDDERHTPGDAATEEAPQICTICERVLVATLEHVHELDGNVQSDETGHWYNCAKCDEKAEYAEHIYLFDCDALCDGCGYARTTEVAHTPSDQWASDENSHWYPCTVCQEKVEEAAHTGDVNVAQPKCDICAHEMIHEHLYEEAWISNVEEHWHECVCGDKDAVAEHIWDEGMVTEEPYREKQGVMTYTCTVCGALDTAIIIETSRDLLPWWIACGVLGAVVLGMGIVLIVILVKIKKKPKGKYAVELYMR